MKDTLATGEAIKLSGFGSLVVKQKNNRRGRNPQTGEPILGSRSILTYKVSSVLKDAINKVNP
jgi:integration host factor subunit alpha